MIDQLFIEQEVELFEILTGFETSNRYKVLNSNGQQIYYAMEESSCISRVFCSNRRGFVIPLLDNSKQEVMRICRNYKLCAGTSFFACSSPCILEVWVEDQNKLELGRVRQTCSFLVPSFDILNAENEIVLKIRGPICVFTGLLSCCDQNFDIFTPDLNTVVGRITKSWSGFVKEAFTDATNIRVSFPIDLDVRIKATLMAAVFLIDFMFFEKVKSCLNFGSWVWSL